MKPKPRRGRPPRTDKVATERIEIRVTRLERAAWEHAAAQAGITVSEWIRKQCKRPSREDEDCNLRCNDPRHPIVVIDLPNPGLP